MTTLRLLPGRPGAMRRLLALVLVSALALSFVGVAAAQKKEKPSKPETKKVKPISEMVAKRAGKIQEAMEAEDWALALEEAQELKKKEKKLDDHEKALMYQLFGYIYSSQEDFVKAVGAFEQCVVYQRVDNPELALKTQFDLAQLYLATGNFQKAVDTLEDWFKQVEAPEPRAYYMMSIAYLQLEQPKKALPWALDAVKKVDEKGEQPMEGWLQLVAALHFTLEQFDKLPPLLERLISLYPKRDYWIQLANVYSELKKDKEMLAVYELAYLQGFLRKHNELVRLAHLYLYNDVPYRSAEVIEKGRKDEVLEMDEETWRLLANSYLHAREYEKALEPLGKAASLSEDGDLYVQLAQVRIERQEWSEAISALDSAFEKGDLDNQGSALVLKGVALMSMKKMKAARATFMEAKKHNGSEKVARQWIEHIDREAKIRA